MVTIAIVACVEFSDSYRSCIAWQCRAVVVVCERVAQHRFKRAPHAALHCGEVCSPRLPHGEGGDRPLGQPPEPATCAR